MPTKIKDLITVRIKLSDYSPDLAAKYGEDAEFIRKGITPANLEIKDGERAIISYISTAAVDRDGEIVLPSGCDLKHYRKNPVVLFGHNYRDLPIGKNMWIKSDEKGLIAKTQYATHDKAEEVYNYRKEGFPMAESIGFIPTEYYYKRYVDGKMQWLPETVEMLNTKYGIPKKDIENCRAVYTKWILLEYSDVPVPANQEATQIAIGKGLIDTEPKVEFDEDSVDWESHLKSQESIDTTTADFVLETEIEQEHKEAVEEEAIEIETLVNGKDIEAFARALSILIKAGVPLKDAAESLCKFIDVEKKELLESEFEVFPKGLLEESYSFSIPDEEYVSFDKEAFADSIKMAVKENLSTVREGLKENVSTYTKESIARLKGKVLLE